MPCFNPSNSFIEVEAGNVFFYDEMIKWLVKKSSLYKDFKEKKLLKNIKTGGLTKRIKQV
jgi:hypothetical protein